MKTEMNWSWIRIPTGSWSLTRTRRSFRSGILSCCCSLMRTNSGSPTESYCCLPRMRKTETMRMKNSKRMATGMTRNCSCLSLTHSGIPNWKMKIPI